MFENEKNDNIYGKITSDFDFSIFDKTDGSGNDLINNEEPFDSDMTAILKEEKNKNHYLCPKCRFFPYIQIKNQNEIHYICHCTKREGKDIKIKNLEILKFKEKQNINSFKNNEFICNKHRHKFRYYCINCHINICKKCCEFHLKEKHDLIIFDFNNYDICNKINKLIEFFNSKQSNNNQIIEIQKDPNISVSELLEKSSIFQEESNSQKFKDEKELYKIKLEEINENLIIEDNNLYYLYELFKIIYCDYLEFPNYSHFFNIENLYNFIEKKMSKKYINNNVIKENNELNNSIYKKGKDTMTIIYKNNNQKIKLFGSKFIENNFSKVYIEIDKKYYKIMEYFQFYNNQEEVKIFLYILEKEKTIDLSFMFSNCVNLKSIYGISGWTTKITVL